MTNTLSRADFSLELYLWTEDGAKAIANEEPALSEWRVSPGESSERLAFPEATAFTVNLERRMREYVSPRRRIPQGFIVRLFTG
jgi:hypothetical protein